MATTEKMLNRAVESLPHQISFLQYLHLPAYYCDAEGQLLYLNDQAAEHFGKDLLSGSHLSQANWSFEELNGQRLASHPLLTALKEGSEPQKCRLHFKRSDGPIGTAISSPRLVYGKSGNLVGGYDILMDISNTNAIAPNKISQEKKGLKAVSLNVAEHLQAEQLSISRNEDRYHKMVEEVQDYAILLLDIDGTILNWNKGAEKIKGYSEKEVVGKSFRIFYLEEDKKKNLPERLIQIAKTEGKAMQEGWRKRKDGSKFWGFIVITALHDKNDNLIGFSKVTRDLSERKASEDQLKLYAKNIELKNKQLEEYAYAASHDLQEPLRKIQIFTELLSKNIDKRELALGHLEKINSSAKRMSTLIKDVLKYSQLSQPDDLWSSVDLNEVLQHVIEDHDLLIEEKDAAVIFDKLPIVQGISIQMHQLFSNLLGNSLKFTENEPRIEIKCSSVSSEELPQLNILGSMTAFYKIEFKDNGPGFDPQYQEHIFKLFKRLHSDQQGTGIGLALCQKIVENHKGSIGVFSEKNKGTVFTIYLPA